MADFHQNGTITTLHNLTNRPVADLEADLLSFAKTRPMSLILPSLYSELEGPALSKIVDELGQVGYLNDIVIGLDRADTAQYKHALEFFSRLPQTHNVLWNDGPRLRAIDAELNKYQLAPKEPGKGRNAWYCLGYVQARGEARAIGLHDCDIVTYDRSLLARLLYPVANPAFNYQFCKGYYARTANDKMNGRVARLLVTPLLLALKKMFGPLDFLEYLNSYKYPLAGEFSMQLGVAEDIRIPSDWGLEIGVLAEVYRNYSTRSLCQVDIADAYDHKHQDLSAGDDEGGLSKMSIDITKAVIRKLATQGVVFNRSSFRSLKASYYRTALDLVDMYHDEAKINGLNYDIHAEETAVELFAGNIMKAGKTFMANPRDTPFMPSWNRVRSAMPDIMQQLLDAVEADAAEFSS